MMVVTTRSTTVPMSFGQWPSASKTTSAKSIFSKSSLGLKQTAEAQKAL